MYEYEEAMQEVKPVPFIVGVGRSGTTLLRLMLDAHPDLAIPPETQLIGRLLVEEGDKSSLDRFISILQTTQTWKDFGMDHNIFRQELEKIEQFDLSQGLRCFYGSYAKRFKKPDGETKRHFTIYLLKKLASCCQKPGLFM